MITEEKVMNDKNTVNLTISVTKEERKALKQAALDSDISVSALVRQWLIEYQNRLQKEAKKQ